LFTSVQVDVIVLFLHVPTDIPSQHFMVRALFLQGRIPNYDGHEF